MANEYDNAAAFPQSGFERWAPEGGLTKREFFAALAMQAYIGADPAAPDDAMARTAVNSADALLAALQQSQQCTSGGGNG